MKHLYFITILSLWFIIPLRASVLDIRPRNTTGCAPLRVVFDNYSIGVDSIAIDDHLIYMAYTINYYADSIVMVFPQGYAIDISTYSVAFRGYDHDRNLVGTTDYFAGIVHWNFGPARIDNDTVCTGEILNITFPIDPGFQDAPYNHADLGDGTTFDGAWTDLVYYYSSPGDYHISATWHPACPPSETDFLVHVNNCAYTPPHFTFTDSVCSGTPVTFTLNFNNGESIDSIRFNYGEGITSSNTHTFAAPGNYQVKALYYYRNYLLLTFTDTIHITSTCPVVDIRSRDDASNCAPVRRVLDNFSIGVDKITIDDHLIYMDYTVEYYKDSIVMNFPSANVVGDWSTYSFSFNGYDSHGNLIGTSQSFGGSIYWNFGPATINKDKVCNGEILNITFPVFYPGYQDTPYNHADLGDGATFDGPLSDLAYYYSSPGVYNVSTNWHPVCPPSETDFIVQVNNCTTLPPHFSFKDSVCAGSSAEFTLNFNNGQGPDSIRFNYGEGITPDNTHTFATPGNYQVKAYYYYRTYLLITFTDTIHILPCPCTAELRINKKTLCPGKSTNFCAKAKDIDSVLWNFGDGTTSNKKCVEKSYSVPGIYYINLTVYSPCGTRILSDSVTILGATTTGSLFEIVPDHAVSMTPINFNVFGNFKNVEWHINKASISVDSSIHSPDINDLLKIVKVDTDKWVYTYMQHFTKSIYNCGMYIVTFKHNTCGIVQSETKVLDIDKKDADGIEILKGAEEYLIGQPVELSATGASVYLWSFGDNLTELTFDPLISRVSHIYNTPGIKTIKLSTVDDCIDLNYKTATVSIIDKDYSRVGQLSGINNIEISPNPVKDDILLRVPPTFGNNFTVTVYNSIGKVLIIRTIKNCNSDKYTLNFQNMSSGTYFIKVENGNKRQYKTFVKE